MRPPPFLTNENNPFCWVTFPGQSLAVECCHQHDFPLLSFPTPKLLDPIMIPSQTNCTTFFPKTFPDTVFDLGASFSKDRSSNLVFHKLDLADAGVGIENLG